APSSNSGSRLTGAAAPARPGPGLSQRRPHRAAAHLPPRPCCPCRAARLRAWTSSTRPLTFPVVIERSLSVSGGFGRCTDDFRRARGPDAVPDQPADVRRLLLLLGLDGVIDDDLRCRGGRAGGCSDLVDGRGDGIVDTAGGSGGVLLAVPLRGVGVEVQ